MLQFRPICTSILSPATEEYQHKVKNWLEFVEFTKSIILEGNYVLVSLEVISLFSNITCGK